MKKTVTTFAKAKQSGEKLTMLTAYDYSTAKLMDESGVDAILVGDSLGNVILGYDSTVAVTMEDMIHHGAAVARGAKNAMVVVDMPFMSYQTSVYDAVVNASEHGISADIASIHLSGGNHHAKAVHLWHIHRHHLHFGKPTEVDAVPERRLQQVAVGLSLAVATHKQIQFAILQVVEQFGIDKIGHVHHITISFSG